MSRAARQGPRLAGVPLGQQRYIIFFISQGEPHGYIAFGIDVDVDTTTYGMGGGDSPVLQQAHSVNRRE
jgi:hypothetical protein